MIGLYCKKAAAYALLPGIVPRIREIFFSGFGAISYVMAVVLVMVRLLPSNHRIFKGEKVSIIRLFAESGSGIVLSKNNIDQILIYIILLAGFVLICLQIFALISGFFVDKAMATMPTWTTLFVTDNPDNDIAFMLLDLVFGVPDLFDSKYSTDVTKDFPTGTHIAMQALFSFYSNAILSVGVVILIYHIFSMVVETVQTGSPFGERFASVYAPIRLVMAVFMLLPLGYGYNAAQYLILYSAKWGSSLGTNAWLNYNATSGNVLGVQDKRLIANTNSPKIGTLIKSLFLIKTCQAVYNSSERLPKREHSTLNAMHRVAPNLIRFPFNDTEDTRLEIFEAMNFQDAFDFARQSTMTISFGTWDPFMFPNTKGNLANVCGRITIKVGANIDQPSMKQIIETYFTIIKKFWWDPNVEAYARLVAKKYVPSPVGKDCTVGAVNSTTSDHGWNLNNCTLPPEKEFHDSVIAEYQEIVDAGVYTAIQDLHDSAGSVFALSPEMASYGWGGSGIWFNTLAQVNSIMAEAMVNIPLLSAYPNGMVRVAIAKFQQEQNLSGIDMYNPVLSNGTIVELKAKTDREGFTDEFDLYAARSAHYILQIYETGRMVRGIDTEPDTNVMTSLVKMILGDNGIINIREQKDVHPFAILSTAGTALVNKTLTHMFGTLVSSSLAEIAGFSGGVKNDSVGSHLTKMFSTFAMLTFSLGFILGYIMPLIPFMYVFFAVARWIKSIFEAMVAAPLWALAHLNFEGDGLPGQNASQGYFLVLEIFMRPVLIIFGLLASMVVFDALSYVLMITFDILIANSFGGNIKGESSNLDMVAYVREGMDELYITIMYAIMMYVLLISSFKLIDTIPQSIFRWFGTQVSAFGDNEEPLENLTRYAGMGASMHVAPNLMRGLSQVGDGAGSAVRKMKEKDQTPPSTSGAPPPPPTQ